MHTPLHISTVIVEMNSQLELFVTYWILNLSKKIKMLSSQPKHTALVLSIRVCLWKSWLLTTVDLSVRKAERKQLISYTETHSQAHVFKSERRITSNMFALEHLKKVYGLADVPIYILHTFLIVFFQTIKTIGIQLHITPVLV